MSARVGGSHLLEVRVVTRVEGFHLQKVKLPRAFAVKVEGKRLPVFPFSGLLKVVKVMKRIVSKMVVQIKSGKRKNGKSFCCNLYRKRSNGEKTLLSSQ